MKDKIIIWGGNGRELSLENIDSFSSLLTFFLTKYLSPYFDIINILDMDTPEKILLYPDCKAVLAALGKGFSNRIIQKGKEELYFKIKDTIKGPLCSVADTNDLDNYYEDIIFTIRKPKESLNRRIAKKSYNTKVKFVWMGWPADSELCYPDLLAENDFNVFIDHPPYNPKVLDCTTHYYKALKNIEQMEMGVNLQVFQQNNSGVVKWNFDDRESIHESNYKRHNKVSWSEMISWYKKSHIFCVTHLEGAGLAAIEAAMSGAKLYIPKFRLNRPFLAKELLAMDLSYSIFRMNSRAIEREFLKDIDAKIDRHENHKRIEYSNSWKIAAQRVRDELVRTIG